MAIDDILTIEESERFFFLLLQDEQKQAWL